MADARRLNVAVTRAKRHCAIFADVDTLTDARARAPAVTSLVEHAAAKGRHLSALEIDTADHGHSNHQAESSSSNHSDPTTTNTSASSSLPAPHTAPPDSTKDHHIVAASTSTTATPELAVPTDPTVGATTLQSVDKGTPSPCTAIGGGAEVVASDGVSESSFSLAAFLEAGGCGDLTVGSTFLMHRPTKGFVVDVSVRCRSQQALVKTCAEEPVACFRRRVALAFGFAQPFAEMPFNETEAAYRLVCKGRVEIYHTTK